MAGITLSQAQAKLALWMEADDAVAAGQAHTVGNRTYTAADADTIARNIERWDRKCKELDPSHTSITLQRLLPCG